jgi:hypothetical protein
LKAGRVFLCFIEEVASGSPPKLKGEEFMPTFDRLVPMFWHQKAGEDGECYRDRLHDIEKREIRSRFPVAHLAAAIEMLALERNSAGGDDRYNYQDHEFLKQWVLKACRIADHIRTIPECELMASRLIDLRWAEAEHVSAPGEQV